MISQGWGEVWFARNLPPVQAVWSSEDISHPVLWQSVLQARPHTGEDDPEAIELSDIVAVDFPKQSKVS